MQRKAVNRNVHLLVPVAYGMHLKRTCAPRRTSLLSISLMPTTSGASSLDKSSRLAEGDTVSVAVGAFGQSYAESRGARPWTTESVRDMGVVVGRDGNKWLVKFSDGQHKFERRALSLEQRAREGQPAPRAGSSRSAPIVHSDDEEQSEEGAGGAPEPQVDSSEDEDYGVGQPDHERVGARTAGEDPRPLSDWKRDDYYGVDERARHGFADQSGPRINGLSDWENTSLFALAVHFLPMAYLSDMAVAMTEKGAQKFAEGNRYFVNWKVTRDDLLQWIGVWIYMLAFPQAGSRRTYWMEPPGGFGPRHRLHDYLRAAGNGEKGVGWFEAMHACFVLPQYPRSETDPFRLTRRWWDSLRQSFHDAVTCSWLMVLDESMVRWMGCGMPGLMVILRKPTPVGLELHTLCCALCGVLGMSHACSWFYQ